MRILFFFERYDMMVVLVEKIAKDSSGIGKLRNLQNQIKDIMIENNIKPSYLLDRFSFSIDSNLVQTSESISILNPRLFNIKLSIPHPLDLIFDVNTLLLYNKIMQNVLFFKNAKLNLQQSQ